MPSQTDAILHRLPRSSILRSHTSRSARSEHFVHPLQQETLLISEKIYFLRMCSKKYHILPQPNARNVRPNFRYFPGKNPHEWPHKRAVLCYHLLSFISLNVPLLFRIPAEWTASNLRTAPPRNGGDSFSKPTQFYVEMLRNSSTLTFQTILSKSSVLLSTPQIPGLLV